MADPTPPAFRVLASHEPAAERPSAAGLLDAVSVRQVVLGTVLLVALFGGFALLFALADALFYVFVALVLGTALRPIVDWLAARVRLSRREAAAIVYGVVLVLASGIVVTVLPALMEQLGGFVSTLPSSVENVQQKLLGSQSTVIQRAARELPGLLAWAPPTPSSSVSAGEVAGYLAGASHVAFVAVAISIVGFYWIVEGDTALRTILLPVEPGARESMREIIEEAEARVGGYVRGQLTVCAASAILATAAYLVMGLPNALFLGLFFGLCGALPVFGAPLGTVPAVLLAFSVKPGVVPWVVAAAAIVHVIQDYVLAPRIMGKNVGVSAFTVLLAISAFGSLLGIGGAILAIPMAAVLQMLFDRYVLSLAAEPAAPPTRDRFAVLQLKAKELALDVKKQVRDQPVSDPVAQLEDEVEAIATDLERTLAQLAEPREKAA